METDSITDSIPTMDLTQNNLLRISDDKIVELIKLYEKEECLYNTHLDDYKVRQKRKEAAERIAKKISIPNFDAKHVMLKLKNLRNSYVQEIKKMAQSAAYRPRVVWFSTMDFIKPHLQSVVIKTRQPTLVINGGVIKREPEPEPEPMEEPDDLWEISDDAPTQDDLHEELNIVIKTEEEDIADNMELCDTQQSRKRSPSQNSPGKENDFTGSSSKRPRMEELACQTVKEISAQLAMLNQLKTVEVVRKDVYEHFGTYVASMLRSLPVKKGVELQAKIVHIIAQASMEEN